MFQQQYSGKYCRTYLFSDGDSLQNYLNGEIVAGIVSHPALSEFSVKSFDVLNDLSMITRAPITMTEST